MTSEESKCDPRFNKFAEHMDQFHTHFRAEWTSLLSGKLSPFRTITTGLSFARQLEMHHSIEESYFFPKLAARMPAFRNTEKLLAQHKVIHEGLEKFTAYLEECRCGEKNLRREELKEIMESFGEILWTHMDDEVKALHGEEMRKYWSVEEIEGLMF